MELLIIGKMVKPQDSRGMNWIKVKFTHVCVSSKKCVIMDEDIPRVREESDLLGSHMMPEDAYWGIQTYRAMENFSVSRVPLANYSTLVIAMAMVKKACALANLDLDDLPRIYAEAIIQACDELINENLMDQFVVEISDIDDVQPDDEVVLIGQQGNDLLSAEEVASWCETINY